MSEITSADVLYAELIRRASLVDDGCGCLVMNDAAGQTTIDQRCAGCTAKETT